MAARTTSYQTAWWIATLQRAFHIQWIVVSMTITGTFRATGWYRLLPTAGHMRHAAGVCSSLPGARSTLLLSRLTLYLLLFDFSNRA